MTHQVGLFDTPTGSWWLPLIDDFVAKIIRSGKVFEADVVNEAARHIRTGSTVLDLGSNFGQMAVLFSKMTGPGGRVHAFEADPFVCRILRLNIEENGVTNIVVHEAAVWNESGKQLVYPAPEIVQWNTLGAYGIKPRETEGRTVRSMTIDELRLPSDISFVKIDIQGSDLFAMMGAESTVRASRTPILFEFENALQDDFGTSFADYQAFIDRIGYKVEKIVGNNNYLIVPIS